MKFKTFAITLRPRSGVSDDDILKFTQYWKKKSEFYHIVTEKLGSAKHIHAALFLKKESSRSNVCQLMKQTFDHLDESEKSVMLKGIKVLYSNSFIDTYMDKDDDTVVVESNLPESGTLESWYPRKEEIPVKGSKNKSAYLHELESLWYKYQPTTQEINTMEARNFLYNMMYNKREINYIKNDRDIFQMARHLVRFLRKESYCDLELPPFEKEE